MVKSIIVSTNLFYKQCLGPYLYEFCRRLHALAISHSGKDVNLLFCTRAGYRLKELYELYLENEEVAFDYNISLLPISRLSSIKAALGKDILYGAQHLASVFPSHNLKYVIKVLTNDEHYFGDSEAYLKSIPTAILTKTITPGNVCLWLDWDKENNNDSATTYFKLQYQLFGDLFRQEGGDTASLNIIVDSGLYGRTIEIISNILPEYESIGALVYRSNYARYKPAIHFPKTYGIMGSSNVNFYRPESCVLRHWHLIEHILEPISSRSTSAYYKRDGFVYGNGEDGDRDQYFDSVILYFKAIDRIEWSRIITKLNRVLTLPMPHEITTIYYGKRINDLNSGDSTNIIIPKTLQAKLISRDKKFGRHVGILSRSLWPEGQAVHDHGWLGFLFNCRKLITDLFTP